MKKVKNNTTKRNTKKKNNKKSVSQVTKDDQLIILKIATAKMKYLKSIRNNI